MSVKGGRLPPKSAGCWALGQTSLRPRQRPQIFVQAVIEVKDRPQAPHTAQLHTHTQANTKGKEKERKSIYIAPFRTKVHPKRSGMDHTVLPANSTMPAFPSWAFTRWHHYSNWGIRHPIAAYYSFIDPKRMKGWVGLIWHDHNYYMKIKTLK